MFLKKETQESQYVRRSKTGLEHSYTRIKTIAVLRCDNCDSEFTRDLKKMDHKRLSNNYFHVCSNCDSKRFAQRKGVEQKKIWDMPASTTLPVGKF
jgi:Zn finger protein HypA/HybF involved in hydrogenase expression